MKATHELARKKVKLNLLAEYPPFTNLNPIFSGDVFIVEDWADNALGKKWEDQNTFTTVSFDERTRNLDVDDDVIYGHVNGYGHLVFASELGDLV